MLRGEALSETPGWEVERISVGQATAFTRYRRQGPSAGPHVVVLGGVHGDEPEGVLAAGTLVSRISSIARGSLTVVPVCNEAAFEAGTRRSPIDDNDLARCFGAGGEKGPTSQLATALSEHVLSYADVLVDLHTGGRHYDLPLLVGCFDDGTALGRSSRSLARTFGAPFLWLHDQPAHGRTTSVVHESGGIALYAEAPGGDEIATETVDVYLAGVGRILRTLGLNPPSLGAAVPTEDPIVLKGSGDLDQLPLRSESEGFFLADAAAGDQIARGSTAGRIVDIHGCTVAAIGAPGLGVVAYMRRPSTVRKGDALLLVAPTATWKEPS